MKLKITPIIILLPIMIVVFIYNIYISRWTPFTILFIVGFIILIIVTLLVDRILLKYFAVKFISIIEYILIFLIFIISLLSNAKFYYEINDDVNWFVIIPVEREFATQINYSFPFNKTIYVENEQILYLSKKDIGIRKEEIKFNSKIPKVYSLYNKEITEQGMNFHYKIYVIYPYELSLLEFNTIHEYINKILLTMSKDL